MHNIVSGLSILSATGLYKMCAYMCLLLELKMLYNLKNYIIRSHTKFFAPEGYLDKLVLYSKFILNNFLQLKRKPVWWLKRTETLSSGTSFLCDVSLAKDILRMKRSYWHCLPGLHVQSKGKKKFFGNSVSS